MQRLERRIPPPVILLLVAGGMWLARPEAPPGGAGLRLGLGLGLLGLGLVVSVAGAVEFRRAGTTLDPRRPDQATALVVTGVFRWTRNPMYLGLLILLISWAAVLGSAWLLAGPLFFMAYMNRFQIRPEERALAARFPAWETYRRRVRRWL